MMIGIKRIRTAVYSCVALLFLCIVTPSVVAGTTSSQDDNPLDGVVDSVDKLEGILEKVLDLVLILVFIAFFITLVMVLFGKGEKGSGLIWSVLALFVAVSIWGIITWIEDLLGIEPETGSGDRTVIVVPETRTGTVTGNQGG